MAFLIKFDGAGNKLWGTYYGTGPNVETEADGVAIDAYNNVYLSCESYGGSPGMASDGIQSTQIGFSDLLLVKFDSGGNRLCATYYGIGAEQDGLVAVDTVGNVYLAGTTSSTSGITSGGFQNSYGGGGSDAFLVKMTSCCALNTVGSISGPSAIYPDQTAVLNAPAGYTNYSWVPGGQTTQSISVNPTTGTTYTALMSGPTYCTAAAFLSISILDGTVTFPNVFTPNGDGVNDVFNFQTESIKDLSCTIYDRWGVKLWEINTINGSWDGRDLTGTPCVTGTYYYVLAATDVNLKTVSAKGFLQLMR